MAEFDYFVHSVVLHSTLKRNTVFIFKENFYFMLNYFII